ncbi:HlyD family secretion protein [Candidatus Binatus sp.]|uniref:HlyD family secretion protein n=1 Tax=Candidatus Binatus sp. TaxID=2811406 RepID=UPI00272C5694|nr:HlyD family secretion protein [Candidatus Binatus sp.]
MRRAVWIVVIVMVALAAIPAYRYFRYFGNHVSTDDAYVDGTVALVSSRVAGTVTNVYVQDNWTVKEGDLLLTLDPRDFEVRVDQAQAQLDRAKQSVEELLAQVKAAEAGVSLAGSQFHQAKIDFDRAKSLRDQGVVSSAQYDQASTGLRIASADQALAQHQLAQAKAALGSERADHSRYDRPIVRQAQAALEAAKLDHAYTKITAPFAGIVTHKSVHVGHRVQVGEPLLAVVPLGKLYVTANFKETQLTEVRVGQPAEVEADIYPGYVYHGHVDSISMGTGAAFSLLPPENATGNWVKVVQRVPVKIVFESQPLPDKPLRLGLSVEVAIDLGDRKGTLISSIVQRKFQKNGETMPNETLRTLPMPETDSQQEPGARPSAAPDDQHFLDRLMRR